MDSIVLYILNSTYCKIDELKIKICYNPLILEVFIMNTKKKGEWGCNYEIDFELCCFEPTDLEKQTIKKIIREDILYLINIPDNKGFFLEKYHNSIVGFKDGKVIFIEDYVKTNYRYETAWS